MCTTCKQKEDVMYQLITKSDLEMRILAPGIDQKGRFNHEMKRNQKCQIYRLFFALSFDFGWRRKVLCAINVVPTKTNSLVWTAIGAKKLSDDSVT